MTPLLASSSDQQDARPCVDQPTTQMLTSGRRCERGPAGHRCGRGQSRASTSTDRPHAGCCIRRRPAAAARCYQTRPGRPGRARQSLPRLGTRHLVIQEGDDLADLQSQLTGRITVLIGHSGVGKSTLVNALVPDADRLISLVNAVTGRGRHTSTSAVALPLENGGWVIDTPGIRSFGLAHVDIERFMHAFPDLAAGTGGTVRADAHTTTSTARWTTTSQLGTRVRVDSTHCGCCSEVGWAPTIQMIRRASRPTHS